MDSSSERHTVQRYDGELNHLHYLVLEMGGLVIYQVRSALHALNTRDVALARKVIDRDREMETAFEAILRRLMTRVLDDSREASVVMSLVLAIKALERIGHHTQNLAEYVMLQVKGEITRDRDP